MIKFSAQEVPAPGQFGADLDVLLRGPGLVEVQIGVAWARRSGIRRLRPALESFLKNGGSLRVTVGIDILNTSQEGLEDLMELAAYRSSGKFEAFVYHNEAQEVTYHPKVYLFLYKDGAATLLVGSVNFTSAAMTSNVEAALIYEGKRTEGVIKDAEAALGSWRNPAGGLVRPLSASLMRDLVANGLVLPEATLRTRTALVASAARPPTPKKLFGTVRRASVPSVPPHATPVGADEDRILLIRIRTARGTQTQIPEAVIRDPLLTGATELIAPTGEHRSISAARARGAVNTWKVEIPESASMVEPLLRIQKTTAGVSYEIFDSNSAEGLLIMDLLSQGRLMTPPQTVVTKPSQPKTATWYRFV